MLNHPVEREIAAEFWLYEPFSIGSEGAELGAEFVLADESDQQNEQREISTALLQCHLLLQFLRLIWK